jgi:hypothetical protein
MNYEKYQLKSVGNLTKKVIVMSIEILKNKKVPIVIIDESLATIQKDLYFQDKVDKANEMLKKVGLPKRK